MTSIEWSKPIETDSGEPAHYVGKNRRSFHVVEVSGRLKTFNDDGSHSGALSTRIHNVTPKMREVEAWCFAFGKDDDFIQQHHTEELAKSNRYLLRAQGFRVGPITRIVLQITEK
jgi:hypothetical protein